jgi:hypothetical protein
MRCLADEGVDRQIVDKLREAGHEVLNEANPALRLCPARGAAYLARR